MRRSRQRTASPYIRLTDHAWINPKTDDRIEVSFVKNVSDGKHFVVTRKSPNYMHMDIDKEVSFEKPEQAVFYARKLREGRV